MPLSETLTQEIDSAADQVVEENKAAIEAEQAETDEGLGGVHVDETGETGYDDAGSGQDSELDGGGDDAGLENDEGVGTGSGGEGDEKNGDMEGEQGEEEEETAAVIGDDLLTAAVAAGISISDAREFPNENALERIIETIVESRKDGQGKEEPQEEDILAGIPDLDPEEHGEEVVKTFAALKDLIKKQQDSINGMHEAQEQSSRAASDAVARETIGWFDSLVDGLGEEFSGPLGKGPFGSLDQGSSQFRKRDAIAGQMAVLFNGYKAVGQETPPKSEVFDMAVKVVLADEISSMKDDKIAKELDDQQDQHIDRVGGTRSKRKQSPVDETAEMINRKFFQ